MLQICSNGRSEKVNKRLRRGNKRMWFLINLKEKQQGDLVNPSFICCLRPLVCLLHNVVFKRGGRKSVCGGLTLRCFPPNEMSTDLTALRKERSVLSILLFIKLRTPPPSNPIPSPLFPQILFFLLLSHLFEASFAASWLWRSQKAEAIIGFVQLRQA